MQVKSKWAQEKLNIGAALQYYRNLNCLTYVSIEKAGGPNDSFLSALESGKRNNVSINILLKLCNVLNVSIVDFIKKAKELSNPLALKQAGILDKTKYVLTTEQIKAAIRFCEHQRKLLNMTIKDYCKFVGMSDQAYRDFRNRTSSSRNTLAKIAKALNVTMTDLISF